VKRIATGVPGLDLILGGGLERVTITDAGLIVGEPLEGVTGRLGWSALRTQDPPRRADSAPAS
jgi:hypothetical protein